MTALAQLLTLLPGCCGFRTKCGFPPSFRLPGCMFLVALSDINSALCFEIILISELEGNRQFIAVSVIITSLFRFHEWHIKLLETILKQLIEMNSTSLNFKVIITQRSHLKRKEIRSVTATPTFVFPRFIL